MNPNNPERIAPISPEEVTRLQAELMPPAIIETFNRTISEKIANGRAVIDLDEIVKDLTNQGLDERQLFNKGWLNIEELYREAGWEVSYEQPAYNETGRSYFTFQVKK